MAGALDGVKVLDFSWVVTGPLATKVMAEHGATVVRIESEKRPDMTRSYVPYANGPGVNRCAFFAAYNNDKYGMTLNLVHPRARSVVERLARWADIAVENFTPGAMERLGFDQDALRATNPALIVIRTSLFGQTGPYKHQAGFGGLMQSLAGLTALVGWPDRPPVGSPSPLTDFIGPWWIVAIAMKALEDRRQTGQGQYCDLSQMEAALHSLAPGLLDAALNERAPVPNGNRHPEAAPHGVFRCQGEDRWCAIAATDDREWRGLCRAMGRPEMADDPKFASLLHRKEHEDELEHLIESWAADLPPETVMSLLQAEGAPAGLVVNGKDMHEDPQLAHRGHFVRLHHSEMGDRTYDAPSFRLSETPAQLRRAAHCLGEHTELVCREIIGMSDDEFLELLETGVLA